MRDKQSLLSGTSTRTGLSSRENMNTQTSRHSRTSSNRTSNSKPHESSNPSDSLSDSRHSNRNSSDSSRHRQQRQPVTQLNLDRQSVYQQNRPPDNILTAFDEHLGHFSRLIQQQLHDVTHRLQQCQLATSTVARIKKLQSWVVKPSLSI